MANIVVTYIVMANTIMTYIVMANIVMACITQNRDTAAQSSKRCAVSYEIVMACMGMAYGTTIVGSVLLCYIVMAYIVMAYIVMAYIVMAYIVMAVSVSLYTCAFAAMHCRQVQRTGVHGILVIAY